MNYSCGLGPHLTGSLRRGPSLRRSLSTSKHIGGVDWHLRAQFADQLKCFDLKFDTECLVLVGFEEYYRRLAVVEQDYADQLAKLANYMKQRHANEIAKRPHWIDYTITSIFDTLLGSTLYISEAHSTMAEIYAKQMIQRLIDMEDDAGRLYKQCREIMIGCQERVLAYITKLQVDQREYANRHSVTLEAERVFKKSENKLEDAQQKASSKGKEQVKSQRCQRAQTEYYQKKELFESAMQNTSKARNNYLLQLAATNYSIARYFTEETHDISDCFTCGFHNSLTRLAMMHMSCIESLKSQHSSVIEVLGRNISTLDWRKDKACFFKSNETSFTRPSPLPFVACKEDPEYRLVATGSLREDLENQAHSLSTEIKNIEGEIDVTCRTLEKVEKSLLDLINQNDYDVSQQFRQQKHDGRSVNPTIISSSSHNNNTSSGSLYNETQGSGNFPSTTSSNSLNSLTTSNSQQIDSPRRGGPPHSGSAGQTTSASGDQLVPAGGRSHWVQSSSANNMKSSGSAFLDLRAMYRDKRIDQEQFYLNIFNQYTMEMHKHQVLQAKLVEISQVLGIQPTSPQASRGHDGLSFQPGDNPITVSSSSRYGAVPVLPIAASQLSPTTATPVSVNLPQSGGHGLPTAGDDAAGQSSSPISPLGSSAANAMQKPTGRRVLRVPIVGNPKLFGGTIDEYVAATGQTIPRILLSCARAIVEFGISQQGIFRVSGSQVEISRFKLAFERGEDPLVDICESRDIHSAIGVLKLYFRELGEPPFSAAIFHDLLECIRDRSDLDDTLRRARLVVSQGLSRPGFIVMRYLFGFLNHITEHSEENLMDAHNLAICFGPTLMPVPAGLDLVHYQGAAIELIETFITHHSRIFDFLVPGPTYTRQVSGSGEAYAVSRSQLEAADRSSCASVPDGRTAAAGGHFKRMVNEVAELAHQRMHKTIARLPMEELQQQQQHSPQNLSRTSSKSGEPVVALHDKLSDTPASSTKSSSVDNLVDSRQSTKLLSSNDNGLNKDVDNSCDDLSISDSEGSEAPAVLPPYTVAVARAAYTGRTARELSFQRDDELLLYRQLSPHWWEGCLLGNRGQPVGSLGLIPHFYVLPKAAASGYRCSPLTADSLPPVQAQKDFSAFSSVYSSPVSSQHRRLHHSEGGKAHRPDLADVSLESLGSSKLPGGGDAFTHLDTSIPPSYDLITLDSGLVISLCPRRTAGHIEAVLDREHGDDDVPAVARVSERADNTGAESAPSPTETGHLGYGIASSSSLGTLPEDAEVATTIRDRLKACQATRAFDSAIDEIVRGLKMSQAQEEDTQEYIHRADERKRQLTKKICLPLAKHTPDLVLDLLTAKPVVVRESSLDDVDDTSKPPFDPHRNLASSSVNQAIPATLKRMKSLGEGGESAVASGADTFAEQNLDTMRKRHESVLTSRSRLSASLEVDTAAPDRVSNFPSTRAHETKATSPFDTFPSATAAISGVKTPPSVRTRAASPKVGSPPRPTPPEPTPAQEESGPDKSSQRKSIAARVAAFETNSGAPSARPALAPKPRKLA